MQKDKLVQGVYITAKGVIGSVPTVGTFLSELFGWVAPSPIERKRNEFLKVV